MENKLFAPVNIEHVTATDGSCILRVSSPLGDYPSSLTSHLLHWAEVASDRIFLAERDQHGDWYRLSYSDVLRQVLSLSTALLDMDLGTDRPIAILSGNSINHALLTLAALHVGIPVVPISPAYSLVSKDFAKLKYIMSLVEPGLVYVEKRVPFAPAIDALDNVKIPVWAGDGEGATSFQTALQTPSDSARVATAYEEVSGDSVAKILFTSGSTGMPKGVINTHRMLCSNQESLARCWPFVAQRPPVLVDWLPWSHTFGSNHNFNLVLRNGGTLYIDAGKPAPALIGESVKNLKDISPTIYFNVPAGYNALLPYLESDPSFAEKFFRNLDLIFYAAAALPQITWDRMVAVSKRTLGKAVPMTSAWGATETAPLATSAYFRLDRSGVIGVPIPGTEIKLAPVQDKLEIRVRGPNVTPGYLKDPLATRKAFDEEGFYCTGDAVVFRDPADPSSGLVFDGRLTENFKLTSGTWVNVGMVRTNFADALSPYIQDVVIAGENREALGVLAFPNVDACRQAAGDEAGSLSVPALLQSDQLRDVIREKVAAYNRKYPASSTRITRLLFLTTPPDIDAGETTDKGYLNQRMIIRRRAEDVVSLFSHHRAVIDFS